MTISATTGVTSNIDYQTLISQLVSVKQISINQLTSEKTLLERKNSAYSALSSRVEDLKTAADALRTDTGFKDFTTTVSDSNMLGATASSSASNGNYQIVVSTIAKSHKIAADGTASSTSTVAGAAGLFSFKTGSGTVQSVNVDATTTLTGLKDSINALKAGVTATIVNDGNAANPYRLVLTSDNTGTANAITITQNDTSLLFPTTLQAAVDASFTVDGLTCTRSSNSVSDVITGVTLDLKAGDPAKTITLSVNRDTSSIEKKVSALVDKYNAVVSYIKSNNRYDSTTKTAGVFFGDPVARSVWEDLRNVMTSAVSGLPDTMNRLLHIGVKSDSEGMLTVDSSKLKSALSSNFTDVVNLFVKGASTAGFGSLVYDKASSINDFVDGRIKSKQAGLSKNITALNNDIREKESELTSYENQVRAQFTALETMLSGLKTQSSYLSRF